ncbi:efflux RND transporter periplasmic adaptor subunit [Collinsella tanakaei]|uniref:efflux RND transporter periplasmic adaptor subunit n=1 Tax=Collinsella tanakaei TaxID=626935 RepID=UPI0019590D75|nr:efflux RND transporter periplasmic adaptor subunit [Collinsella tanakaei]MBM6756431.1 efflux RND transporter periplasmic adaptor subunit [Collinsella tanakaei]
MTDDTTPAAPARDALETLTPDTASPEGLSATDAQVYDQLKQRRAERRRKKLIRRGIAAGIVAAVIIAGVVAVNVLTQEPETVAEPVTEMAMAGSYIDAVDASGSLEPLSSVVITPTVDGTISEIRVAAGQQVAEGDLLMVIDNPDLDLAVEDAKRNLEAAQESLASARRARDDAYAQAQEARAAQARADELALQTAQAQAQAQTDGSDIQLLDSAGATTDAAPAPGGTDVVVEVDTQAAEDAVSAAERGVESAQAALDQAVAKANERQVTSPLSGSVVVMNAQVGASPLGGGEGGSAGSLMQIADLSQMKVTIQVSEQDIASVAQGQTATVTFPAFEDIVLQGTVQNIASVASGSGSVDMYTGQSSVTFAVDILIPEPDPRLKPGMTAQVSIVTQQLDNVVMVSPMALLTDDGTSYYVMVETDPETHAAERRDVEVAARNENFAVVGAADGAAPGDPNAPDEGNGLAPAPISDGDILIISGGSMDLSMTDMAASAS